MCGIACTVRRVPKERADNHSYRALTEPRPSPARPPRPGRQNLVTLQMVDASEDDSSSESEDAPDAPLLSPGNDATWAIYVSQVFRSLSLPADRQACDRASHRACPRTATQPIEITRLASVLHGRTESARAAKSLCAAAQHPTHTSFTRHRISQRATAKAAIRAPLLSLDHRRA